MRGINQIQKSFMKKAQALEALCTAGGIELPGLVTLNDLLHKEFFDVAFIGEFTAGKSTLINALLEQNLLPMGLQATTARITFISHGQPPRVRLQLNSGKTVDHPYAEGSLKELAAANPETISEVESIHIDLPATLLQGGIRFIDTPGTNDTEAQRVALTYKILPQADAVVYVTIYPVTVSNLKGFEELVLQNGISNVFFILNKADELGGQLDVALADARQLFEERAGGPVRLFPVSALDYLEGVLDNDPELSRRSQLKPFIDELGGFLAGSEKFLRQENQYNYHLEKLKGQAAELLRVRLSGITMPEEEFNQRRAPLETRLVQYAEEAKRVAEDTSAEIDRLTARLERSLDKLLLNILEDVDLKFDLQTGDHQALLKLVEAAVHQRYEAWRHRNEPVIRQFLETVAKEIQHRMGEVVHGMKLSLADYMGGMLGGAAGTPAGVLLGDERKSAAVLSVASIGTYAALALAHVAIAPVAMLIAPVGIYLMHNRRQQERKILKDKVMAEIRQNSESFKHEVLREIRAVQERLAREIADIASAFTRNIQEQLREVDRDRKALESDLALKRTELAKVLEQVGKL